MIKFMNQKFPKIFKYSKNFNDFDKFVDYMGLLNANKISIFEVIYSNQFMNMLATISQIQNLEIRGGPCSLLKVRKPPRKLLGLSEREWFRTRQGLYALPPTPCQGVRPLPRPASRVGAT